MSSNSTVTYDKPVSPFWWVIPEDMPTSEAWRGVMAYVHGVDESQSYQHDLNVRNARLYTNADMLGLDWTLSEKNPTRKRIGRVVENVIQSVCDTATAMIAKNRPRAAFMTDGADWSLQRKAKLLEKYVEGQFALTDIYREGVKVFRDAIVFGTGAMKMYINEGEIKAERVLIDEIIVDEREARAAYPRQMHHRKMVSREVLKAQFPEHANEIDRVNAPGNGRRDYMNAWSINDPTNVYVIESWHLPSKEGAPDGVHSITIEGLTLLWEKYDDENFPFVFYRWSEPLAGFYGQGLSEQLTGIQLRINKINNFIQKAQDLIAVPRVFVDVSSKQLKPQFTNEVGTIIPYRGKPPIFMTPQAVGAEIYTYKQQLKNSAYELAGISQLSATSQKPVGLESAVALREYNDIETQRFAIQAQEYEEMFLHIAYRFVSLSKKLYKSGFDASSVWNSNNYAKKIKWSEVDMEETVYVMQIEASSILSRTPAGRMQQVIEMAQSGLIDKDEARKLLQHPDLKSSMDLFNAMIEDIDATIEALSEGVYQAPESFQNLALGQARVQMAYLKAKRDGAPDDILDGMRQWIEQANAELKKLAAEEQKQIAEAQLQAQMQAQGGAAAGTGVAGGDAALAPQAMILQSGRPRSV